MKHTYTIRYYESTVWSFFTQADHFEEAEFDSDEDFATFCKRMFAEGFQLNYETWIAPSAITKITQGRV